MWNNYLIEGKKFERYIEGKIIREYDKQPKLTDLVGWMKRSKLHYTSFRWFLNHAKPLPNKTSKHRFSQALINGATQNLSKLGKKTPRQALRNLSQIFWNLNHFGSNDFVFWPLYPGRKTPKLFPCRAKLFTKISKS